VPTLRAMPLHEVPLQPLPLERFQPLVGAHGVQEVRAGDVALLHDPQTAGLTPDLADAQVDVVWRGRLGRDEPNAETAAGWRFLAPYLARAAVCVYSRRAYRRRSSTPRARW